MMEESEFVAFLDGECPQADGRSVREVVQATIYSHPYLSDYDCHTDPVYAYYQGHIIFVGVAIHNTHSMEFIDISTSDLPSGLLDWVEDVWDHEMDDHPCVVGSICGSLMLHHRAAIVKDRPVTLWGAGQAIFAEDLHRFDIAPGEEFFLLVEDYEVEEGHDDPDDLYALIDTMRAAFESDNAFNPYTHHGTNDLPFFGLYTPPGRRGAVEIETQEGASYDDEFSEEWS